MCVSFRHLTQTISLFQRTFCKRGWTSLTTSPGSLYRISLLFVFREAIISLGRSYRLVLERNSQIRSWSTAQNPILPLSDLPSHKGFKELFFKKCRAHLVQKYNLLSRHFPTRFVNDQSANIVNNLSICEVNEAKLSTTDVLPPGKPLSPVHVIQILVVVICLLFEGEFSICLFPINKKPYKPLYEVP